MQNTIDVIIIGAGAAGLFCAIEAGKRGRKTLVLDHTNKPGKKILMSGGGRCNFTNYYVSPEKFISHNPHFCKSALKRYTQWDFIELVKKHKIPFHEKSEGQLFCDNKSKDILEMLLLECKNANVTIQMNTSILEIKKIKDYQYEIATHQSTFYCHSLVIATGGLSIPTLGASLFGYQVAEQFGINVWPTRAALVPFTWSQQDKEKWSVLSGISLDCEIKNIRKKFCEPMLFTHRGLSGPGILQISSYWNLGEIIQINLLPQINLLEYLKNSQKSDPKKDLKNILGNLFPKRLVEVFFDAEILRQKLHSISHRTFADISKNIHEWSIKPNGTEGYRTAEVTVGGIDCNAISSHSMEALQVPGLYFIGEVLDVTGWLGGYNFQWAWSSGWAAGQHV